MEKELCCFLIYSVDRVLRGLWMGEEQSAAAMTGVTEEREKNGRKTETRIGKKFENSRKNFQNPLDNRRRMWYTIGAAREQPTSRSETREKSKVPKEPSEKT